MIAPTAPQTARRFAPRNRVAELDTTLAGRLDAIRSEWTEIDYAVRKVDNPVEQLLRTLDSLPAASRG